MRRALGRLTTLLLIAVPLSGCGGQGGADSQQSRAQAIAALKKFLPVARATLGDTGPLHVEAFFYDCGMNEGWRYDTHGGFLGPPGDAADQARQLAEAFRSAGFTDASANVSGTAQTSAGATVDGVPIALLDGGSSDGRPGWNVKLGTPCTPFDNAPHGGSEDITTQVE